MYAGKWMYAGKCLTQHLPVKGAMCHICFVVKPFKFYGSRGVLDVRRCNNAALIFSRTGRVNMLMSNFVYVGISHG